MTRRSIVAACLAASVLATPTASLAKDPQRAAEARELWTRIDAAQGAERLDVPHRVVVDITTSGSDGTTRTAVAARTWWSKLSGRDESQGPDGSHVRAVVDGIGWSTGDPRAGTTALRTALTLPELREPSPRARMTVRRDESAGECLEWNEKDPPTRRMACLREGRLSVIEANEDRWELSEHAPMGSRIVARRIAHRRAQLPATVVVVRELAALEGPPSGVLEDRPPEATDVDLTCEVLPPRLLTRVEPEYTPGMLPASGEAIAVPRGTVNTDGSVSRLSIASSAGSPVLDQAAMRAVERWTYAPATCGGKPRAVFLSIRITFRRGSS